MTVCEWRWDERKVGGGAGDCGRKRRVHDSLSSETIRGSGVCVWGLLSFPTHLALSTCTISGVEV